MAKCWHWSVCSQESTTSISGGSSIKDQIADLETKLAEEKVKIEAAVSEAGEEIKEIVQMQTK